MGLLTTEEHSMSTLLSKYKAPDKMGCTQKITPE
ncbi:5-deoxy-glucuronate isomerase, partial [Vibrio anguillarum]|nr:5-deoxy-glucuronate isomerase [Vibrio anguillarum]